MRNLFISCAIILLSYMAVAQKQNDILINNHRENSDFKIDKHHSPEMTHFGNWDISLPVVPNTGNAIQVDSVFITNEYGLNRDIYSYDVNGNVLVRLRQELDGGLWMNTSQGIYTYNSNGNRLIWLTQNWEVNSWVDVRKTTYAYDTNGNALSYLEQEWANGEWENTWFVTDTFDMNNNFLSELVQFWENGIWVNLLLFTDSYNENGDLMNSLSQNWEDDTWVNNSLYNYLFDVNGDILTELRQDWGTSGWENHLLFTSSYDDNNNKLTNMTQIWEGNQWIDGSFYTYSYDLNGNIQSYLYQVWDENAYENSYIWIYTYDDNGNRLESVFQKWIDNTWENSEKVGYSYTPGMVTAIPYIWEENIWVESQQSAFLQIYLEGDYVLLYLGLNLQLYYTEITGIDEQVGNMDDSHIITSPNPVSTQINIEIEPSWQSQDYLIALYNQNGQKLKSFGVSSNDGSLQYIFNVEDVPAGLYILKVDNGKQVFTQKIIVSR